jgi:hypothetical protein
MTYDVFFCESWDWWKKEDVMDFLTAFSVHRKTSSSDELASELMIYDSGVRRMYDNQFKYPENASNERKQWRHFRYVEMARYFSQLLKRGDNKRIGKIMKQHGVE